jgi:ribosomal protein S18 acetylase RimI-like enzyme
MEFIFETAPSVKEMDSLEQNLLSFNCSKVENYAYEDFLIKAISASGAMVAGIHAHTGGDWLYIASLWVDEDHRGRGLGKRLLGLAEETAIDKKCHGVYLYTYSFQSPDFYHKHGYVTIGTLDNFFGNHKKYYMVKKLT